MTDPADRHLQERLHALAHGVSVPLVPAAEDVRRGRRRLVRVRLAMAGATTGTLVMVLGITGLTAGDPTASDIAPATRPPSTSVPTPPDASTSAEAESSDAAGDRVDAGAAESGLRASDPNPGGAAAGPPAKSAAHDPVGVATGNPHRGPAPGRGPTPEATVEPSLEPTLEPTDEPLATSTAPTPVEEPTDLPSPDPSDPPTPPPTPGKVRIHRVLAYFNEVVAGHLDPERAHLQAYDRALDPQETTRSQQRLLAVGSTYRWHEDRTTTEVGVRVASGWDQVGWGCGDSEADWDCHPASTGAAEVAERDGILQVAVEHTDGQVVVVGADLAEDDLVAAASDPRLVLPGDPPPAPPTLEAGRFAAYGRVALVHEGETFTVTALDRTPAVRGTWTGDGDAGGALSWSVRPIYSGGGWTCSKAYRSCVDVPMRIDGVIRTVHLAALRKRLGGGWLAQYDGPSYAVRVTTEDRRFPKKRAYLFVTDDDWQPTR